MVVVVFEARSAIYLLFASRRDMIRGAKGFRLLAVGAATICITSSW